MTRATTTTRSSCSSSRATSGSRTDASIAHASPAGRSRAACARREKLEAALAEQEALRVELEALGEADGYVFEELGECLLALGRDEEARPHFGRAAELLAGDPSLAGEAERLERLRSLAQTEP